MYGPGATAQNADRRRVYANCPADGGTCDFSTIAMLSYITHSNYDAGQVSLSRRYAGGVGFNVSYWLSSTKDELSSMNLSGAAAKPLAGENDLAQNPFDVGAEYGPSLFDARHRFVASASWGPRVPDSANSTVRAIFGGWQLNGIATLNSGTPFTVSDSANVSLQANSPPISGLRRRPSQPVGDPNAGPAHRRRVDEPVGVSAAESASRRPASSATRAATSCAARATRTSTSRSSATSSSRSETRLELRIESFNVTTTSNFGLPVADLNSANFGRILSAGPPRLMQFGVKLIF